jgi:hypothetical protein
MNKKLLICLVIFSALLSQTAKAQNGDKKPGLPLAQLQQQFVDLRFGMFIHFNGPGLARPGCTRVDFQSHKIKLRPMGKGGEISQYELRLPYHQAPQRVLYMGYQNHRL